MLTRRLGLIGTLKAQDLIGSAAWKLTKNNVDRVAFLKLKSKQNISSHFCIRVVKIV